MKEKKTFYYSDELNDDFAANNIKTRKIGADFPFVHNSRWWRALSGILLFGIVHPIAFIINKIWFGVKIKNRRAVKGLKDGYFLYGNHTIAFPDATCPAAIAFPKRAYVVAGADAVSIRGIAWLVQMLGGLILPTEPGGMKNFTRAVEQRCKERAVIAIYPEAHLWPYYTGIRPFRPTSFAYPLKYNRPVVACVTTYRKRFIKSLPPAVTITLSDPIYADKSLSAREARDRLRNKVYNFMLSHSAENEVEYLQYIKRDAGKETASVKL